MLILKKLLKNTPKISLANLANMSKSEKVPISVRFLLKLFLCAFFTNFFNKFEISVKFCVFLITILEIWITIFFVLQNGSKKRKTYHRIILGNHQRVRTTKLSKSFFPIALFYITVCWCSPYIIKLYVQNNSLLSRKILSAKLVKMPQNREDSV